MLITCASKCVLETIAISTWQAGMLGSVRNKLISTRRMHSTKSDRHNFSAIKAGVSFSLLLKMSKGHFGNLSLALQDLSHVRILKVLGVTKYRFFS
jgi:hypothetical protein